MPHFFVPPKNFKGRQFFFDPSESRHLSRVLRKKPGDLIRVFDGAGTVQDASILDISDAERVTGELSETPALSHRPQAENIQTVNLYPAILKGPRFDWLLEKLTELSVTEIHPLFTARTVIRIPRDEAAEKTRRWEKIILSAAKQCGRKNFAKIFSPLNFEQAVLSLPKDHLNLILWESEEKMSLSAALARNTNPINLLIGPEGGFSVQEADFAISSGVVPVHLGENILRAETAAIAAAARILLS